MADGCDFAFCGDCIHTLKRDARSLNADHFACPCGEMHPIGALEFELVGWGRLIERIVLAEVQGNQSSKLTYFSSLIFYYLLPSLRSDGELKTAWIGRRDRHRSRQEADHSSKEIDHISPEAGDDAPIEGWREALAGVLYILVVFVCAHT
jgi:hypothetical protein